MMKQKLVKFSVSLVLIFFAFVLIANGNNKRALHSRINKAWVEQDYDALEGYINKRLKANPSDLLGLGLQQNYFFYIKVDDEKAKVVALKLKSLTENHRSSDVVEFGEIVSSVVLDDPGEKLTEKDLDSIKDLEEFPLLDFIFALWISAEKSSNTE